MTDERNIQVDEYQIRCARLGHTVSFSYCRKESKGLPCFKTLDCWFEYFPVEAYLRGTLSDEEWKNAFEMQRPTKVQSLLDLIAAAKKQG